MKRVLVNEGACIGCRLCEIYCEAEHSKAKGLVKAFKDKASLSPPRLSLEVRKPIAFAVPCRHCLEPPCVYACLTGALRRDPVTGIVNIDAEKCIGCCTCMLVCPLGAIRYDQQRKKVAKCDLCAGKDLPACVANCPNEALVYA